jgi:hypothetical protein
MGDETLQCAQDVSLALVQRDKAKGRQLLKDWMTKSELHELFVVRKLLQMEMDVGDDLRLQTLIPAMYVAEVGNRWFPLQPAGKKVEAKVKSMVETVCGWYEDTQAMVKDLAFGMQAAKGDVSWEWVELAAAVCDSGVSLQRFTLSPSQFEVFMERVAEVQRLTQADPCRYSDLLKYRKKTK